jgi:hypothetical protein
VAPDLAMPQHQAEQNSQIVHNNRPLGASDGRRRERLRAYESGADRPSKPGRQNAASLELISVIVEEILLLFDEKRDTKLVG